MEDILLGQLNNQGKLIQEMVKLTSELSKLSLADEDNPDDSEELKNIKSLIVQARVLVEDDLFSQLIQ